MKNAFSCGWPARLPKPGKQPLSKQVNQCSLSTFFVKNALIFINTFERWAD